MATTEKPETKSPPRRKESETPISPEAEQDEFYEAFDSERIAHVDHPNLGFKSMSALNAGRDALSLLSGHPDISSTVIGKYLALLDYQKPHIKIHEGRRSFLKRPLFLVMGVIGATWGLSAATDELSRQDFVRRQALERFYTLGLTPPSPSAYGWTVRYPQFDPGSNYTENQIIQQSEGDWLAGPMQSVWSLTGIRVYSHTRTSDGVAIPKLSISTKVAPSTPSNEEWVLRTTEEARYSSIDSRVVILEKKDEALPQPLAIYLSIRRVDAAKPIEVKIMKLQK